MPTSPEFPGNTIRRDSPDGASVRQLQQALNSLGLGPLEVDGVFGAGTEAAVRHFQSLFFDASGQPLAADGAVGPATWAALFGPASVTPMAAGSGLAAAALDAAEAKIGVREEPPGSNAGPEVEKFLASVGLGKGNPWCAAFVYWCVDQAARKQGVSNPLPKTGSVMDMWNRAQAARLRCLRAAEAQAKPSLVTSGMVFIMSFDGGKGHTGFVKGFAGGNLATIEGNSNDGGSRDGIGVFSLKRRTVAQINAGFIGLG